MKNDYLDSLFNLEDKTVLVTGATGQLGSTICEAYSNVASRVIGTDKKLNKKRMVAADNVTYLPMDIADKKSVQATFKSLYSRFGKVDIVVNNAGVSVFEPFEKRPEKSFDQVMDTNLKGTFFCIQAYAHYVRQKKQRGNIVNIASVYGVVSPDFRIYTDCKRRNSEVYGATKAGIIQMTRYFAAHLAPSHIRVNCISPGGIHSATAGQGGDFVKKYSYRSPMGRLAKADEMIGALLYLSSDASTYTTGQNIVIDGGLSCW